jgi:ankyrin repeat protein
MPTSETKTTDINYELNLVDKFQQIKVSPPNALHFFQSEFARPSLIPLNTFESSMKDVNRFYSRNHPVTKKECTHPYVQSWDLKQCDHCNIDLGGKRLKKEEKYAALAKDEDNKCVKSNTQPHFKTLHGLGISILALLAFTFDHNCWEMPTWEVVRNIIKPATEKTRCRYAELKYVQKYFGPARVFISHCWSAKFGDLVMAACQGARFDRYVWIDIFAVRQWPGNVADLDFRGVIGECNAMIVSLSFDHCMEDLREFKSDISDIHKFFNSYDGQQAKKLLAFCRLWCVVELASAVLKNVPVIVKGGKAKERMIPIDKNVGLINKKGRGGGAWKDNNKPDTLGKTEKDPKKDPEKDHPEKRIVYFFEAEKDVEDILANLQTIINVETSECTVESDKIRELGYIRNSIGISEPISYVNRVTKGVLCGAEQSVTLKLIELDAAICGENESFRNLSFVCGATGKDREIACNNFQGAVAGGRINQVKFILTSWGCWKDDQIKDEGKIGGGGGGGGGGNEEVKKQETTKKKRKKKKKKKKNDENVTDKNNINNQKILSKKNKKWIKKIIYDSDALCKASQGGHSDLLELILYQIAVENIDVNDEDQESGATPLRFAIEGRHVECVKVLLKHPLINVNQIHPLYGETPLMCICQAQDKIEKIQGLAIIKLLLNHPTINIDYIDNQPRINPDDEDGDKAPSYDNALMNAANYDFNEAIELLLKSGARDSLFSSAARGDIENMKRLLINVEDINDNNNINGDGSTILHYGCENGHLNVVKYLINTYKIDINCANMDGETALIVTCSGEYVESTEEQIIRRANVVSYLMKQDNIDPNVCDYDGDTAFICACREGNLELIKIIMENGRNYATSIDINHVNDDKENGLICAIRSNTPKNNNFHLIKYLLQLENININQVDVYGNSTLYYASELSLKEQTSLLLQYNAIDTLQNAVLRDDIEKLKLLIEVNEVNVNKIQGEKRTCLHIACLYNKLKSIQYLLSVPVLNINAIDKYGRTPLFYACEFGYDKIVSILLHTDTIDVNKSGFNDVLLNTTISLNTLRK